MSQTQTWSLVSCRDSQCRGVLPFDQFDLVFLPLNLLLKLPVHFSVLGPQMLHQFCHPLSMWICASMGNLVTNLSHYKLHIFSDGEIIPHFWLLPYWRFHKQQATMIEVIGDTATVTRTTHFTQMSLHSQMSRAHYDIIGYKFNQNTDCR